MQWNPGPFVPDYHEYIGRYFDNPEVLTVVAVTDDPGTSITVNGQPCTSGQPLALSWDKWTPWFFMEVLLTDQSDNTSRYFIVLEKFIDFPFVDADKSNNIVSSCGLNPGATATMTVRSSPGGIKLIETTGTVGPEGIFRWDFRKLGIPVMLNDGMEVSVTDGEVTVRHVILPLSIDNVDFDNDIVYGTGVPGGGIELQVCPDGWEPVPNSGVYCEPIVLGHPWPFPEGDGPGYDPRFPNFVVDPSGHWEFDLSVAGIDLTEKSNIGVNTAATNPFRCNWDDPASRAAFDPFNKGGTTAIWWPPEEPPEPGFIAIIGLDAVVAEIIVPGIPVDLTIRSSGDGSVLLSDTKVTDAEGNAYWGIFPAPELGIELEPGMEVIISWEGNTVSTVLDDISVIAADPDSDIIAGNGPPGEYISIHVVDFISVEPALIGVMEEIIVESDGTWQVEFTEDIRVGMVVVALWFKDSGIKLGSATVAAVVPEAEEENVESVAVSDEVEAVVETFSAEGTQAQVVIPPGALPSGTSVKIAAITNTEELIAQTEVPDNIDLVIGYSIETVAPDGTQTVSEFDTPVTVSFTIDEQSLPSGYDPDNLKIAFWNGVRWTALEDVRVQINPDGSVTLTALTDHFTLFAVILDIEDDIQSGPVDPLDEVSFDLPSLSIYYQRITSAPQTQSDTESTAPEGISTTVLIAICIGVLVLACLIFAVFYFRRRKS